MADDGDLRRDLLWRIEARRGSIQAFLRAHRPRTRRRATITVVLSSLAALFTAGPALGGEPFAQSVQDSLGLASDSYVWRTLCLLALLVSVAAAVLTNLGKAQDDVARLSSAEAANTELEGLTGLMQFGHLSRGGRRQALPAVHRQDPVRRRAAAARWRWPRRPRPGRVSTGRRRCPASTGRRPRSSTRRLLRRPATTAPQPPGLLTRRRFRPRAAPSMRPPAGVRSQARCVPSAAIEPGGQLRARLLAGEHARARPGRCRRRRAPSTPSPQAPTAFRWRNASCSRTTARKSPSLGAPSATTIASNSIDRPVANVRSTISTFLPLHQLAAVRGDDPQQRALGLQRLAQRGDPGEVGARPGHHADDPAGDRERRRA